MADINITESLDDRDVVAAFARQLKLLDSMEKKLDATAKASKKTNDDTTHGLDKIVKQVGAWGAGLVTVSGTFDLIVSSTQEAQKEAEALGRKYDGLINKMKTLGNWSKIQTKEATESLNKVAEDVGWSFEQAGSAANSLMSAGASDKDALGDASRAVGEMLAAAGMRNEDPEEYATSAANYLKSTGRDVTGENIRELIGKPLIGLDSTNMTPKDLPALTKVAGSLNRLSDADKFSGMANLMNQFTSGAEAATAFRGVMSSLTTKGNSKSWQDAMRRLGVNPEDVDFLGEDLGTGWKNFAKAYDAAPEATRDNDLGDIFGTENVAAAQHMMKTVGTLGEYKNMTGNTSKYWEKVGKGTSGRNAGETRLINENERLKLAQDQQLDLVRIARENLAMEKDSGFLSAPRRALSDKIFDAATGLGVPSEWAHEASQLPQIVGRMPGSMDLYRTRWGAVQGAVEGATREGMPGRPDPQMNEQTAAIKEQTAVLQDIRGTLARPNPQQVTPPVLNSGKPTR